MEIIKPSFEIETPIDGEYIIRHIEKSAKTCYKKEHTISTYEKAEKFVKSLVTRGHHSTLEHFSVSVRIICDRGVSHEIVRHRLAAYSQESTRYCDYSGKGIQLIHPEILTDEQRKRREDHYWEVQKLYDLEISEGLSPQIARGVLPTSLKTELVMSCNLREWRHVFNMRAIGVAGKPHPQMTEIMIPMLYCFKNAIPIIFDDLNIKE